MERLQRMFQNAQAGMGAEPGQDNPTADNSEMVYISSLSLLKVHPLFLEERQLLHGRQTRLNFRRLYLHFLKPLETSTL
jgi:hypothetical protein